MGAPDFSGAAVQRLLLLEGNPQSEERSSAEPPPEIRKDGKIVLFERFGIFQNTRCGHPALLVRHRMRRFDDLDLFARNRMTITGDDKPFEGTSR